MKSESVIKDINKVHKHCSHKDCKLSFNSLVALGGRRILGFLQLNMKLVFLILKIQASCVGSGLILNLVYCTNSIQHLRSYLVSLLAPPFFPTRPPLIVQT